MASSFPCGDDNIVKDLEVSSKKKPKGNKNCCVPGCESTYKKNPDINYHLFPKAGEKISVKNAFGTNELCDRRKLWESKLKMGKKASNYMVVCSLHFKQEDYECSGWSTQKRLSQTAIPSKNLPVSFVGPEKCQQNDLREARLNTFRKKRLEHQNDNSESHGACMDDGAYEAANTLVLLNQAAKENVSLGKSFCDKAVQTDFKEYIDSSAQVSTSDFVTVSDLVHSDAQLNNLTGIQSFTLFNTIVYLLNTLYKDKRVHRLSVYKRVFLVFMKLKLDLPYVVLSVLFNISRQSCKNIFVETCSTLSQILKTVIYFPTVE